MTKRKISDWVISLDDEELEFIRNFMLKSGSLKDISKKYGVSYPTVRLRLDRIIQKIELSSKDSSDNFILSIKNLIVEDRLSMEDAKLLINKYKEELSSKGV